MYPSDGSATSLIEESLSLSKVTCVRSRAMFHRKLSQASHVRRMIAARLTDEKISPSFMLPSNHPNVSKKTKELKVKDVSFTGLKFGRLRSQSSEGFGCNNRQKFGFSARKCSSSAHTTALTKKCYSENISLKQNEFSDQQERFEAPKYSKKGCDAEINSSDHILPLLSKFTTGNSKKKNSIFSNNPVTSDTRTNCENFQKETLSDVVAILKPVDSIECPQVDTSIQIITPNHFSVGSSGKACSGKGVSKPISDYVSIGGIGKREYSNSLQKKEAESFNINDAGAQMNGKHQVSVFPRKKMSSSIKPPKEKNFKIENLVPRKEAKEETAHVTSLKTVPKEHTEIKRKGRKMRNSKKKTKVSSINDKSISSQSSQTTLSLDSLNDQNKTLGLKYIKTTPVEKKVQCLSEEMASGKSMKSLVTTSTLKTKTRQTTAIEKSKKSFEVTSSLKTRPHQIIKLEKQQLPSKIPLPISRIKRTKIIPKECTSLDSLDDLIQTLGSRYVDLSIGKVQSPPINQADSEVSKDPCPNAFSAQENSIQNTSKKRICQSSRLSMEKEKNRNSEKNSNPLENHNTRSSDLQYDTSDDLEDQPEALRFANVTGNANANKTVSTWLKNLPQKTELTSGDKKKNGKIDGSLDINTVGEDSDFKGTSSSIDKGCKKQNSKSSENRPLHKMSTKKFTCKSQCDTDSCTSLPSSSCKSEIKGQIKNRKSVINTDKLLGKFNDSFSGVQFLESPIQKFMDEINSALTDFESDE